MSPAPRASGFRNSGMKRSRAPEMLSWWNAKEGVAAVEFALIATVLVPLFCGAVSLGLASWTKMQVGNAARAGAVYAANHGYDVIGIATAAQNATALSGVTVISLPALQSCTDPETGQISLAVTRNGVSTCPGTGSPPGDYVTVTTQKTYSFVLSMPGFADTVTLSGKAVARIR